MATTKIMMDHHFIICITVMRTFHSVFFNAAGKWHGRDGAPVVMVHGVALSDSFCFSLFEIAPEDEQLFFQGIEHSFICL